MVASVIIIHNQYYISALKFPFFNLFFNLVFPVFPFGYVVQLAESQFPGQGLNLRRWQ